ncbi:MAG: hypothetical protein P8188_07865 [Gemmatimonadota bacterium]|jgi:hypothetical protein
MTTPTIFDERDAGGFRGRFRHEMKQSWSVDLAVKRLRLSAIDLDRELEGIHSVRLVLARVRAAALDAEAHVLMARPEARARLTLFLRLMEEGRMRIRVAPLGGWSPDFTVFTDARGPRSVLMGFHQFERVYPHPGPALGACFGRRGALMARARFEEIWGRSYDILPAIHTILARARRWADGPGPEGYSPVDTLRALG